MLARVVAAELPEIATVARPLGDRGGKVYVDFLQNGFGKTIAAPFSVAPAPGRAGVDAARLDGGRRAPRPGALHHPHRARAAAPRRADPMRAVLETSVDVAAVLDALRARMTG